MNAILTQLNRLNRVKNMIPELMAETLIENRQFVEELNQKQLGQGIRADGSVLPDYKDVSVRVYGKPPGPIRLFDTGDFYDGIKEEVFDDGFRLVGTDQKTGMLTGKYGKEIIGLTRASKDELVRQILRPSLQKKTKREIQK